MSEAATVTTWRSLSRFTVLLPLYVWHFLLDWWYTRPWRSLLFGLPAVAVGVAALWVGWQHGRTSPDDWLETYHAAALSALHEGDLEAADVYFRRLAHLDGSSPAALYGLALTAERQGDPARAREVLRRIAPDTEAGYAPAHYWLAQDMLRQRVPATPQALRVLQHHLRQATRNDVHQWDARVTLAQLYVAGKEPAKAIAELERVVAARPELQLDLARLYAQTGRTSDARLAASKAAAFFQARAAAEPDQPQHQLRWAASEVLRADYEQSVKILTAGLSRPDPQPFRQALAAAYLGWLDARRKEGKLNAAQQAEFLERIIEHDPQCAPALAMLAELATRQDEDVEQAAALLRRILARGAAPAVVHLILGTRALHQGNAEVGLMHLEQAQQQNARIPEVLNNLAWGLAQQEQPDLPRALQLAEAALKLSSHPEIHDTLGTVLAQLGRPREAVTHLERALRGLPARADAHRKLAALYEQLGDSELAAEHRRLAQPQEAGR